MLRHFSEPDYPVSGYSLEIEELDDDKAAIRIHDDNIEVETLANLLQTICPSALPSGFTYSYGNSKPRPDDSGGGFVAICKERTDYFENGDTRPPSARGQDERECLMELSNLYRYADRISTSG